MNHSITAFDRKHLAPKDRRIAATEPQISTRTLAFIFAGMLVLTAFHYLVLPEMLHSIAPDIF